MFENGIDQSIHTIKNTSTNTLSKIGKPSSFFLTAFLIESLDSSISTNIYIYIYILIKNELSHGLSKLSSHSNSSL